MKTFWIQTLGCKVNHYESEQIGQLLRQRGLIAAPADEADLRVINTCSVTMHAASQSRQAVRRTTRLPVLSPSATPPAPPLASGRRVIVTGCWATSNGAEAAAMPGVDAVLGHHHNLARELDELLDRWRQPAQRQTGHDESSDRVASSREGQASQNSADAVTRTTTSIESRRTAFVNELAPRPIASPAAVGAATLPLLGGRQSSRQRAYLKVQDGCDAHCTYCIIPSLRPTLWSKPVDDAVAEARALVASGHVEIVLTGIFLGAYGQSTALRRRQPTPAARALGELVSALCRQVEGLRRLRLSSLEPGDLTEELLAVLASHRQVVPHFHLPLQSGSELLLRRMNRQYTREQFLEMIGRLRRAFDRPALTSDVVVGFPGETEAEFEQTVDVVRRSGLIHVHAFPWSPRPGTAAARWTDQFVRGPVVNERIERLGEIARQQSLAYRRQFLGESVEVIVEQDGAIAAGSAHGGSSSATQGGAGSAAQGGAGSAERHGRCERYFSVNFTSTTARPGDFVPVRIAEVTLERTSGEVAVGAPA